MEKHIWRERYINQLAERGLDLEDAEADYEAGLDDHDYDANPEDIANDEADLMEDDGK